MSGVVLTALAVERLAVAGTGGPRVRVQRTGTGPVRAAAAGRGLVGGPARPDAVLLAGVGGGTGDGVAPGDLVVASEVRRAGAPAAPGVVLPGAGRLAAALRCAGLRTHLGPVAGADAVVTGGARVVLARAGVLAVDTESTGLLAGLADLAGVRVAVVRVVVDTADHPLRSPGTAVRGVRALRVLHRAAPVLRTWLQATGAGDDPHAVPAPARDVAEADDTRSDPVLPCRK